MPRDPVLRWSWLLLLALARSAPGQEHPTADSAEALFTSGRFPAAERAFLARWSRDSADYHAAFRLGTIALFANRAGDAERWLAQAAALNPDSAGPKSLLGEARYRRDDFAGAAPALREAGRTLRADKLASFGANAPNQVNGPADVTRVPFVMTDPLPMVPARVNGSDTLFFLIDTGGGELTLDSVVARAVGAITMGTGVGVFAGGAAPVTDGRVDSVRIGDFLLRHVPVRILNTRQFASAVGGHRVDGVIGTIVLYHFLATIDYPRGQLVLRRRTPAALRQFERDALTAGAATLPFWLAGDHFMFTWGSVNGRPPVLLFVDTGLAGGGFVCSEAAAREYGIDLARTEAREGVSGAGRTRERWFSVDSLSLGPLTRREIRGVVGTILFRQTFGFDAGGIVSHQFFRPYALTFDFDGMRLFLTPGGG